ncbi:fibronectin type III domain-containing protein, partial [Flavobacterium enshiense]
MTKKHFLTLLLFIGALSGTFGQCPAPTNLAAMNITHNSTTLAWTSSDTATRWEMALFLGSEAGRTPDPNMTTISCGTNPFTITGLSPCTAYKFIVRSVCSPTGTSAWSQPGYFTTNSISGTCPYNATIYATGDIPTSGLSVRVSGGTPPYTFQWSLNGNTIQGATSQNLVVNGQGGTYQVTVTDSGNQTTTSTITIQGISITANNDSMTVYPTSNTTVNTLSVLSNDRLNNYSIINYNNVILTPLTVPSGFAINPNGTISVLPGTAAGTYTLTYQICSTQIPTTCSTATATVTVANEGFILKAFVDTNNNGTQDAGESNFNFGQFTYQINNTGATTSIASSNGMYYIQESNPVNS